MAGLHEGRCGRGGLLSVVWGPYLKGWVKAFGMGLRALVTMRFSPALPLQVCSVFAHRWDGNRPSVC